MSDYWDELEKMEEERDAQEYAEAQAYKNGWNDALDEYLNNISESIIWDILAEVMKRNIVASEGADKVIDYLQKVAKQLKEQEDD